VPHAEHLPVALDVAAWAAGGGEAGPRGEARGGGDRLTVLHVPTNRLIKGTRWIEAGVARAAERDPRLSFRLLEHAPWREVRDAMAAADVVVDQVFLGWYGLVAVEAMALGKPVVGFVRPDFEPLAQSLGLPLVRCTKDDVGEVVAALAGDPGRRAALGEAGRAYARRVHDAPVVARRLVETYEAALAGGRAR
jgi:glycosyltransferase involved in cell wall biosynthesis